MATKNTPKNTSGTQLEDTGERLIPEKHNQTIIYGEHLGRYKAVEKALINKVVLDIACGTGYGAQLMAKKAKAVIGVDISEEAIRYAQKHYPARNVEYKLGSATKIPLEDSSVDIVVSMETIEHVKNQEKFLEEVKRVLKPGGNLFVSTPNDKEYPKGNHFHVREHSRQTLAKLLNKYFENTRFYYQTDELAATIISEERLNKNFATSEWKLVKNLPLKADKCIYFLASCSDKNPLELEENTILAEFFSHHESSGRWLREKWMNDHIQELERWTGELESELKKTRGELQKIRNSRWFRMGKTYWSARAKSEAVVSKVKSRKR